LLQPVKERNPVAILRDLSENELEIQKIVHSIKEQTSSPIVAFRGHVATAHLEEARTCSCDVVTTNGVITG